MMHHAALWFNHDFSKTYLQPAREKLMCGECDEAMKIAELLSAKYGKITPVKMLGFELEDSAMVGRMYEILGNCPKTPEWLGKQGAYRLAVLTKMKELV